MSWSPPPEFDGYRLVRPIGKGRMGHVYLAEDTLLRRPVAVKFLAAGEPNAEERERLLLEARAIARVQHTNVVGVYRVGEVNNRPYLVSEFVRGEALDKIARPVPAERALRIALGLSRGLAAAHRGGVMHRDIKPANAILSEDGEAKLLDFGLAKLLDELPAPTANNPAPRTASLPPTPAPGTAVVHPNASAASKTPTAPSAPAVVDGPLSVEPANANATPAVGPPPAPSSTPAPIPAPPPIPASASPTSTQIPVTSTIQGPGATRPNRPTPPLTVVPGGLNNKAANGLARAEPRLEVHALNEDYEWSPPLLMAGPQDETISMAPEPAPSLEVVRARANARAGRFSLTREGAVLGTPLYMAPEAWRGEAGTYRSDVYSLGAMLHHLCTGKPVHERTTLPELRKACLEVDAKPIHEVAPALDPKLAAAIDRCLKRDPAERFASGEELRAALEVLAPERQLAAIPEGNPYRGLHAFEAEHRGLFFGRDLEVRAVIEALRVQPFVLVAGDSGVGKSSLCRAGVLPGVRDGMLRGNRTWRVTSFVPGRHPLASLAATLAQELVLDEEELARKMREDPASVGRELRRHLGEGRGVLIFADQLEELITLAEAEEGKQVAEVLGHLAEPAPGVLLLATVRGDFLTRLGVLPGIGESIGRALYLLRPMSRSNIREAIVGPARVTGVSFESEALIESLVDSSADAEGGLPLLQFALAELWEARDREKNIMSVEALKTIGGVVGALARHADGVIKSLFAEQPEAARRVMLQLVTSDGTRARRTEAELLAGDPQAKAALDALVRGRLLVARESAEGSGYEVAHEALLRGWPTLRRWIDEDSEIRMVRERLAASVNEWERLGRPREALWGARMLAEVVDVRGSALSARQREFIEASRLAVKRAARLRWIVTGMVPVLALFGYGGTQVKARIDRRHTVDAQLESARHDLAEVEKLRSEAQTLSQQAFAKFDARDSEGAEPIWSQAEEKTVRLQGAYGRVGNQLELALSLEPDRKEVREAFAELLLLRALAAEQVHDSERRDEYLERLKLYDADGSKLRRWAQPSSFSLNTDPPGTSVSLERYEPGARAPVSLGDVGKTPIGSHALPPGSYRLTLSAPGRATVRYPVVLGRGESLDLSVRLPEQTEVPAGFVYVPPGRFLFGTRMPDSVRRNFYTAVPEHVVTTGGFYIAKNETTFGEWLEYLKALPAKERAARTQREADSVFTGQLALKELAGGNWQLTFQPGSKAYTAKEGEKVVYPTRKQRQNQDWLKMPGLGISFEDAQSYVSWLANSGKVPGARLCTEQEWERAAKGADQRLYTHGDKLEPDDANFDETYDKDPLALGPDEVGSHPASRSPFDLDDMVGNAWEWTLASIGKDTSVARGGAFHYDSVTDVLVNRQSIDPALRDVTVGLRVCATPKAQR